jgi:hypothetical protein
MTIKNPRKLGKTAARYDFRDLMMERYLDLSKLPPLPKTFGHEGLITSWGMLGNDEVGDCAIAGPDHETMLFCAMGGKQVTFETANTIADYSALTGYDPSDPNTDQGSDMHEVMKYRQQIGMIDSKGMRHTIKAYVWLEPGNLTSLYYSIYLFGAAALGLEMPNSAMDQTESGRAWSVRGGSRIVGGHYVPAVSKRRNIKVVTWGQLQGMTEGFYRKYNDETAVVLSEEMLVGGKSPEGFDVTALIADLQLVQK